MMYEHFYGFKEPPFNLTPNSRFFYSSPKHLEAIDSLYYAIIERKGFAVITGEIGCGKTTVCRALLNRLDTKVKTALVTNSHLSGRDLLAVILEDLEVEFRPGSKARLLSQLNTFLIEQLSRDNNVVVIIDEAQNLTPSVLEDVRMLSNLETETEKLIQIILMGQPELKKKLALQRLEQLRQRINVYYHLTGLTAEETRDYIKHRLKIASDSDGSFFSEEAIRVIHAYSKGVPRLINQICDSALLSGYISETKTIDEKIVKEVIAESPSAQISKNIPSTAKKSSAEIALENNQPAFDTETMDIERLNNE